MDLERFVKLALEEDVREGDHTTLACIPAEAKGSMVLIMKETGILAGIDVCSRILEIIDPSSSIEHIHGDGELLQKGTIALNVSGNVQRLLVAERLILNILQRMSGIATKTHSLMELIAGTSAKILDTRKTTPLFRYFEKEAVRIGGGTNHRQGLYDAMMIKDNHIDFARGITPAIQSCLDYQEKLGKNLDIIVEARDLNEVQEILDAPPVRRILLDNFSIEMTKAAVELIGDRRETESSGGIDELTIRDYALCGVKYISMGALTHQIKSLDLSLKADFHVAQVER